MSEDHSYEGAYFMAFNQRERSNEAFFSEDSTRVLLLSIRIKCLPFLCYFSWWVSHTPKPQNPKRVV